VGYSGVVTARTLDPNTGLPQYQIEPTPTHAAANGIESTHATANDTGPPRAAANGEASAGVRSAAPARPEEVSLSAGSAAFDQGRFGSMVCRLRANARAGCTLRCSTPCRASYSSSRKIVTGHPPNHSYNDESAMPTPTFRQSNAPVQLRTKYLGRQFEYRDCTGSTMEDARRALEDGACLNCAGPVCVCDGRFMNRHLNLRRAPVRSGVHG
jgi:hypothetical protein